MATYSTEPERCHQCRSTEKMYLSDVTVDGKKKRAWICDECGYAHVKSEPRGRVSGVKCAKKIRVQRKGYVRRDGTVVRPTTYVECDPGRPGRLTRGSKAGPYKKKPKWITGAGKLGGKGFTKRPERERHAILNDSVGFYGYATTTRMLQVILRSTTIADETRRRVESDLAWMKKKYRGKPGRVSGRNRRDGQWVPAAGRTEPVFTASSGKRMQYMFQPSTGRHAYLDVDSDVIMDDEDALAHISPKGRASGRARR